MLSAARCRVPGRRPVPGEPVGPWRSRRPWRGCSALLPEAEPGEGGLPLGGASPSAWTSAPWTVWVPPGLPVGVQWVLGPGLEERVAGGEQALVL